jgi:hypothetical protein
MKMIKTYNNNNMLEIVDFICIGLNKQSFNQLIE